MSDALRVLRDAAVALAVLSATGVAVNAARPDGIPLVAARAYDVLVPCPEPLGEVEALAPSDPRLRTGRTLVLDAREGAAHAARHLDGAWSVPFDYLDRVPDETVRRVAASGATLVAVYGDGDDPDSGRELARELSGRGVRNVGYVAGGATALGLQEAGR